MPNCEFDSVDLDRRISTWPTESEWIKKETMNIHLIGSSSVRTNVRYNSPALNLVNISQFHWRGVEFCLRFISSILYILKVSIKRCFCVRMSYSDVRFFIFLSVFIQRRANFWFLWMCFHRHPQPTTSISW